MNLANMVIRVRSPQIGSALGCAVLVLGASLLSACARKEVSVTLFEEVTAQSGLAPYIGMTHGAAWGDIDGDGLPDVYVTNHLNDPMLFRNLSKGRFADVTHDFFSADELEGDKHGAAWADYDNDGRPDLVQLTGAVRGVGSEPKRLFINRGTRLEDVAASLGVANPYGRTRMPLWLDVNRDGRLDLFHGAEARFDERVPPFLYVQQDKTFTASELMNFAEPSVPFCILTEINADYRPELVCRVTGKNRTATIFDTATLPAHELELLPATAFEDIAAADFDNDGAVDLFLARKNPLGVVAFGRPGDKEVIADVSIDKGDANKAAAYTFRTQGQLNMRVVSHPTDAIVPERIHLGQQDAHPDALAFDISPATPGIGGMVPHEPGQQSGVYVGFTPPDKWEVRVTASREALAAGKPKNQHIQMRITANQPITGLEAIGEATKAEEAPARLFMNRGGKLVEESEKRGVNERLVAAVNVVSGDFDNDMDVDLFVLASGNIGKQENLLLLNRGNGHFDVVTAAGGAAGGRTGVGDSVTSVDYDRDGFLDLFIATGGSMGRSLGLPSEGGAYQLYHNIGNENHWLEIDLEGTASSRDGTGAIVHVTAGGVTQMRVQDGGVHHRSQNHQRLHFGLAKHTTIDKISVHWPSGKAQEMSQVGADQVLRIKESAPFTAAK